MKRRTLITYIVLGLLALAVLTYSEMNKPRPVNWSDSFSRNHHIPFGCKVFYELMEEQFGDRWNRAASSPYEWLRENDTLTRSAYLLVNDRLDFDQHTLESLLDWARRGNRVLLSAKSISSNMLDTLGIGVQWKEPVLFTQDTVVHELVNPYLSTESYLDQMGKYYLYHSIVDSLSLEGSEILGKAHSSSWEHKEVDFVRIPYGQGQFYVHFYPYAFTNYVVLKGERHEYAGGLMSYFSDSQAIFWDEYMKEGRSEYSTPLYVFFAYRGFKYAYYLAIAGTLLYVFLQGKRKQRPIPVVRPLENQSVNFTRTLGDMYLDGKNNGEIVEMKWEHFLSFIRSQLFVSTEHLDERFFRLLAARSNHEVEELKKLFSWIHTLRERREVRSSDLLVLDRKIHSFKEKSHGKL